MRTGSIAPLVEAYIIIINSSLREPRGVGDGIASVPRRQFLPVNSGDRINFSVELLTTTKGGVQLVAGDIINTINSLEALK